MTELDVYKKVKSLAKVQKAAGGAAPGGRAGAVAEAI